MDVVMWERFKVERKEVNEVAHDYSRLSGRIVEVCKTQAKFADAMGLSERSISLKLNGKIEWKQSEILKACKALKIELSEIPQYFFALVVQD